MQSATLAQQQSAGWASKSSLSQWLTRSPHQEAAIKGHRWRATESKPGRAPSTSVRSGMLGFAPSCIRRQGSRPSSANPGSPYIWLLVSSFQLNAPPARRCRPAFYWTTSAVIWSSSCITPCDRRLDRAL
jgi:hypothetical protein